MGAVNKPDELTVPTDTDHVTALFDALVTTAVNCWVFPAMTVAFAGDAETLTALLPPKAELPPPPHADRKSRPESIRHARNSQKNFSQRESEPFPSNAGAPIGSHGEEKNPR